MNASKKNNATVGVENQDLSHLVSDDFFYSSYEDVFAEDPEVVSLHLDDLLPDESGAVVLFSGDGNQVYLETMELVISSGVSTSHVTASGVDVTGLNVYNFASGLTLYSEGEVIIQAES